MALELKDMQERLTSAFGVKTQISGSACTSGSLDPSHVLLAIGRVHDVAHGSLRLSIGEDLRDEDIETIIRAVKETVEYLRSFSPVWRDLESGKIPHILPIGGRSIYASRSSTAFWSLLFFLPIPWTNLIFCSFLTA